MRFRFLILAMMAGMITVSGCSQKQAPGTSGAVKMEIGALGKSVHPFWSEVELGAMAAGKDVDAEVEFYVPSKEDAQKQAEKIKSWVALGKKAIIFAASDPETVGPAIKDAIAKGIVCLAMDTDAPASGRVAYVGTDNYSAGRVAGETMGKTLGGKGKVCIATGSVTASNSLDRIRGFKDALAEKYPQVTVLPDILVDNEDRATAIQKAKAKIAATPDLAAFYGVYALNGPCAANAVESAGKTGKIKIVCFDTTAEHMNMLKSGKLDACIGQRPYLMGKKSVELAAAIIRDGQEKALADAAAKGGIVDTGVDVVTKADMETYRQSLKDMGIPAEGW